MEQLQIDANYFDKNYFEQGSKLGISGYDEQSFVLSNDIFLHQANMLNDILKLKDKRVLDIGCARGNLVYYLRQMGISAYGEDISVWAYENSHIKLYHSISDVQFNVHTSNIDVITAFHILEHLKNPKEALVNIYKAMNKGGILFAVIPSYGHEHDPSGVTMLTRDDWHKLLTDQGFIERKDLYDKFFWNQLVKSYNWSIYCYERN